MGYATLGFPGGPALRFRIDPEEIGWGFNINTAVQDTVGGRVVQVLGATLSDITIAGLFGEKRNREGAGEDHPGASWRLANRFANSVREMMEWQARDALRHQRMHKTAVFSYPPHNWRFRVYLKDFADPDGGTVQHRTGKFSHGYALSLFVVQDESDALVVAGESNGVISKAKQNAVNEYIGRISAGIGWKPSIYNGNFASYYEDLFPDLAGDENNKDKNKGKGKGQQGKQGGGNRDQQGVKTRDNRPLPGQRNPKLDQVKNLGSPQNTGASTGQTEQGVQE